jgi:hypothetical protein
MMRLFVGVPGNFAVLGGDVADSKQWRFRFADDREKCLVAKEVNQVQSWIYETFSRNSSFSKLPCPALII